MIKVLFLIQNLSHGGAEKVLVNLANNLDKEKFSVTIQTLFDVGVNKQYLLPHINYKTVFKKCFRGNNTLFKLFGPKFLCKMIIKEEYDIVASYLEGATTRIISGCCKKTKKIAWIHSSLTTPKKAAIGFRNVEEAVKIYNSLDRIVAVSMGVKEQFENNIKSTTPLLVLYNTNETDLIALKAAELVDDVDFDKNIINICSVGKIVPVKGYDRLARVHKRLLNEGLKHKIFILGMGSEQKKIERYLYENKLQYSFIFIGFRDNPHKYVAACDFYVCSSHREGFSTAITEALLVETPVISTNCSGAKELLGENNEYGLVVDNNEEGIYQGIKKMLLNPQLLKHYKKQAMIQRQKYSKEKTVSAVESMLEELL